MTNSAGPGISSQSLPAGNPNAISRTTPQAEGSAVIGDHIESVGTTVTDVYRWICQDVEDSSKSSVDDMLSAWLADCVLGDRLASSPNGTPLLERCFQHVLPICNGQTESSSIKDHLRSYTGERKKHEKELYPIFATVANTALRLLQSLDVPGIRTCETPILFHVNDPSLLVQDYQGEKSRRKPDLVVISEQDAQGATVSGAEDPYEVAVKAPARPFSWRQIRTFVECKSFKKVIEAPPTRYHTQGRHYNSESASPRPRKRQKSEPPSVAVQAGMYAAEMFTAFGGRQHVIGIVVIDDFIHLWRYDRQGAIQCSAFNFVQDLPRFLVFLLVAQRFQNHHWGLNSHIDPNFGPRPPTHRTVLQDENDQDVDLTFDLRSIDEITHYGLNGHATNMFPVTSSKLPASKSLVAKVFWPEISRESEPDILQKVYEAAAEDDDIKGHVPQMMFHRMLSHTSTQSIRDRLGIRPDGVRVLHIIVFEKYRPITELAGDDLLRTWWQTVKCHRALWDRGIHHRDVSPSNLLYYTNDDGQIIGVLNDFDLATTTGKPSPTGTRRTGSIPFMAISLLREDALGGEISHEYQHDAESFIWVLLWLCLQYENGALREYGPLNQWLAMDALKCKDAKTDFVLNQKLSKITPGRGNEEIYELVKSCVKLIHHLISDPDAPAPIFEVDDIFQNHLKKPLSPLLYPHEQAKLVAHSREQC